MPEPKGIKTEKKVAVEVRSCAVCGSSLNPSAGVQVKKGIWVCNEAEKEEWLSSL